MRTRGNGPVGGRGRGMSEGIRVDNIAGLRAVQVTVPMGDFCDLSA